MRVSHSVSTTLDSDRLEEVLAELGGGKRQLDLRAGPVAVRFDCRFSVDDANGGLRVSGIGVAPGAGFTADLAVRPGDGSLDVEGELLVSGSLAGLGQRELRFWARRLLEEVLGPDA
jgi:carbon monoxide dehydrogenase subunit G